MKLMRSLLGGFVGAATVTILHECLRKYGYAGPRLDKLGEEATAKTIETLGGDAPEGEALYATSLVSDLISNSVYYSAAAAKSDNPVAAGAGLGILAGLGAVYLPGQFGLDPGHTAGTDVRKWYTVGLYAIGGIVAGAVIKKLL